MSGYTKMVDGVRLEPYFHRYTDTRPMAASRGELFIRPDAPINVAELMADFDADAHAEMLDWLLEIARAIHVATGYESAVAVAPKVFSTERGISDFLYLAASADTPVSFEFEGLPERWQTEQLNRVLYHIREQGHHSTLHVHADAELHADVLAQLRVDSIKIDADLTNDDEPEAARECLEHRFRILSDAGKEHVVQGVEAQSDFEWLKRIGYTTFQGLWFGMPQAAQAMLQHR